MEEIEYSWQHLVRRPYGSTMWDIANIDGNDVVIFMIKERAADIEPLPQGVDVHWKAGGIGMHVAGWKVMPVVVMMDFAPLQSIYETWFNFYGESGDIVREAFTALGRQDRLYVLFFDTGPNPVRGFGFTNHIGHLFRGMHGICRALTPWDDNLFNLAKHKLQSERGVQELWDYLQDHGIGRIPMVEGRQHGAIDPDMGDYKVPPSAY